MNKNEQIYGLTPLTTLTIGQIAQRLHLGTRNTLSTNLQERKGTNE